MLHAFIMRYRLQFVLAFPWVALVMATAFAMVASIDMKSDGRLMIWMGVGKRCERYCLTAYQ